MTKFARRAVEVAGIEKTEARAAAAAVAAAALAAAASSAMAPEAAEAAAVAAAAAAAADAATAATAAPPTAHHVGAVSAAGEGQSGVEEYTSQGQMLADVERDRVQVGASDAI